MNSFSFSFLTLYTSIQDAEWRSVALFTGSASQTCFSIQSSEFWGVKLWCFFEYENCFRCTFITMHLTHTRATRGVAVEAAPSPSPRAWKTPDRVTLSWLTLVYGIRAEAGSIHPTETIKTVRNVSIFLSPVFTLYYNKCLFLYAVKNWDVGNSFFFSLLKYLFHHILFDMLL